jgi:hypothetical protein
MSGFQCKYCFNKWQKKEHMEKHAIMCGFWHRSSQIREDDYDTTPTITELFKVVKEFAYKCDKLQKRVDQLENKHNNRQKKQIVDYLQDHLPSTTAIDFIRTFCISNAHLETVFECDLTAGIKSCIKTHIDPTMQDQLPIRAFIQKPNTLYVYDAISTTTTDNIAPHWHIMTNAELDKLISVLSLKFLQAFISWKKRNELTIGTVSYDISEDITANEYAVNEQIKQQYQTYMIKINGQRINEDKRRNEIRQLLYSYLQKSLPTVIQII